MAKKKTKTPTLTLHGLLGALSYWGTAARLLLIAFISLVVFLIALSEARGSVAAFSGEVIVLIYVLSSALLLDFGYVMVARVLPLRRMLDVASLMIADLTVLSFYAVPKVAVTTALSPVNPVGVVLLFALLVLSLRLLSGFLFSTKRKV